VPSLIYAPDGPGQPLRIGLNLLFLGERAGGVGSYATELPAALLAAEPESELHVLVSRKVPAELREAPWASSVRWHMLAGALAGPAQFAALPPLALARGLDVLHSPANVGPVVIPGVASVVTLHDLIWLHHAAEWEPSKRAHLRMRLLVRHCVNHADRVFAVSQAAADDFVDTLEVRRERIEVTGQGVRAINTVPAVSEAELRARLSLGDARVLLCVAQKRPYKNLHSLVHALAALDDDVVLVLPGSPTAYETQLRSLAYELGVSTRVRFPSWLSDDELDRLYGLSEVFALPSLIEGFGLPILEAMAHGVPVACANAAALPEVAGDAALLFDPRRQEELVAAIRRLLEDRVLAARLVARGHERVARFTWLRAGEASLAGYRHALAARRIRSLPGRRGSPRAVR
jgi:glycosyltransferase involved in cell wall biosynthesis